MIHMPHWGQHNRKEAQLSNVDPTNIFPADDTEAEVPAPAPVEPALPIPSAPAPVTIPSISSPGAGVPVIPVAPSTPAIPDAPPAAVTPIADARSPFEKEQAAAAEPSDEALAAVTKPVSSSTSLASVMNRDVSTIFEDVDATELGKRVVSFFQHVIGYVEDAKSIMDMLNKSSK